MERTTTAAEGLPRRYRSIADFGAAERLVPQAPPELAVTLAQLDLR